MFKTIGITISYLSLWEIFLAFEWREHNTDWKLLLNDYSLCACLVYLTWISCNRKTQILHTRLRTKCSSLNSDLYSKNITESPFCHCGQVENSHHYLLCCPFYTAQRNELFNAVSEYQTISLNLLLYGDASLPYTTNVLIFEKVQKYISDTKRF